MHFRQGDLDGACGPYSLVMALVANGIIDLAEASYMSLSDGRTRFGKFNSRLLSFGGLIGDGTDRYDLSWLSACFGNEISVEPLNGNTRTMVEKLVCAVKVGRASIVGVDWVGGEGHWLLVVGYQGKLVRAGTPEETIECTHLLCLDPMVEAPKVSLWNSVIEVQDEVGSLVNQGPLPSNHWCVGEPTKCKITNALSIIKRK
ncbi:hypothetical protein [Pseudomonas sp. NA-150]|uniref:hypothetical protein n=1 Tax=Pseudomonas sp. NA-150 TaxID=3367525 RepID=UPI0037CC45C9